MRWWAIGLLTLCVPWACGDSKAPGVDRAVGGRAGASGGGGSSGSAGSLGKAASGGSGGALAGGAGGGSAGASGANAGASGGNATGGAGAGGAAGAGGSSGSDAGDAGDAGQAGAAGEAGAGNEPPPRTTSIAIGYQHACALRDDGSVLCWGSASEGQLGIGALGGTRLAPAQVPITDVTQITAGSNHTCALIAGGTVKCWGDNLSGELGNGLLQPINEPFPVDVVGLTDAVAIAAGSIHTCALRSGGTVQCWGRDWEGQLGNGSDQGENAETPVDVAGITNVTGLASGDRHSCALIQGGTVKCWGFNDHGQLGNGGGGQSPSPVDVMGLTGVKALGAGTGSTCAHLTNDNVVCWGWDGRGQLGDGDDDEADEPSPVAVALATGVPSLSVGNTHSCAVLPTGIAQCWGWDRDGALGNGAPTADQPAPFDVVDLTGVASITAGSVSSCAITTDARVYCWGRDAEGEVGNGDDGQQIKHAPVLVEGL